MDKLFPHFSFPSWLFPSVTNQVIDAGKQFYILSVNIGILLLILFAGIGIWKLVEAYIKEDPTEINMARHTVYGSLMLIGGLALISSFLEIIYSI